jgi:hypothetical protein
MPGVVQAFWQGLVSGARQGAQTVQSLSDTLDQPTQSSPAAEPLHWSDLANPSQIAPKLAYGFARSYPTLAGGVAGGATWETSSAP